MDDSTRIQIKIAEERGYTDSTYFLDASRAEINQEANARKNAERIGRELGNDVLLIKAGDKYLIYSRPVRR